MLTSNEVYEIAQQFAEEAQSRHEFTMLMPPELIGDDNFWEMLFDLMQNVVHRNGLVIARRENIKDGAKPPT